MENLEGTFKDLDYAANDLYCISLRIRKRILSVITFSLILLALAACFINSSGNYLDENRAMLTTVVVAVVSINLLAIKFSLTVLMDMMVTIERTKKGQLALKGYVKSNKDME